ncbi:MAG: beta strand repeat-containing protein, partial [Hyphomicrobiaceae bacterium]
MTWIADNGAGVQDQVWAISYDITGQPDPVLLAVNTQLTDGLAAGATVSDLDIAMTAGLGFTAVWESSTATDTTLHMRFASTNTFAGGIVTPGLAGGEMQLTEAQEGGAEIAVDPVIQGYEIVDTSNNSLEVGFHVGFVMQNGANDTTLGDRYGALTLARYEIPVYALDGAGNLTATPSTPVNFGVGAEMAPISIGLDGRRGTADDGVGIVVTSSGLFAANNPLVGSDAAHTAIQGRDISIGSLHDGQLVVTYVGTDERVHLRIYVPNVNQTADRETLGDGTAADVVATGLTTYSELALPFSTTLGLVASPTQMQYVVPQQNGSFGVFWAASGGSGVSILGVIYSGAGTSWTASPVFAVATGLPSNVDFQVAPTGVNAGGLEDGFFVTWEAAGAGIQGQRIDMVGALVGNQIVVGDPASGTPGLHSTAGIDDGRMLVGYQDGNDVSAQYLDNRTPGDPLIGPRTGAPRDVIVGTVGDDAIDGRALDDELYGGLGNDFLTLGTGADIGDGGAGNDSILGGAGQDQLIGQGGDDLLWGGLSGPIDPQVDRDLRTGLAAAGISAALIATDPGADIVSGGAGTDTISFQDEIGNFNVDLSTGIVTSDRSHSGTFILEDVIGLIDTANATFNFSNDVENVTGGLGDDRLTGDAGSNVLDGREGNDTLLGGLGNDTLIAGAGSNAIDGGAGTDTATFAGTFAGLSIGYDAATGTLTLVGASGTDIVSNVETFVFTDGTKTLAEVIPGPAAVADAATGPEDTPVTIAVLANDANVGGAAITAINSIAIVAGGAAVAVAHGSVALVDDGTGNSNVVFTPDADYFGPASFTYTVANASGQFSIGTVSLTITNTEDAPTDILFNGVSAPPASGAGALGVLEGAATGTVIATLTTTDPDNTAVATNDAFTYSLADTFGGRFRIVGGQIQVDNGALLDVESGTTSYTLAVTSSDGKGGSISKNVVVNVTDVDEAPTTVALSGGSIAETAANGSPVGTLSAVDPEGGAVRFTLGNDAGGRFAITTNAAGVSQLIIAENLLIDHRPGAGADGPHTYAISVNALDAAGNSRVQAFTVTTTGVAENRVLGGTAADNTLTGTAGADYIDGGAGKDTMTGQAGNDVYVIDKSGDKVSEAATGGTDTSYT